MGGELLGEEPEIGLEQQDERVDGPVGTPKPGLLRVLRVLERVVGEPEGEEEGERGIDEAGEHE